jgi:hypothetical protein
MTDNYLQLAKFILSRRGSPLTAQQILVDARRFDMLPKHLSGETMEKTLQARISEDIFHKREESTFYRTALGTYFLRELGAREALPTSVLREFPHIPRSPPKPSCRLLYVPEPRQIHRVAPFFIEWSKFHFDSAGYFEKGDEPQNFLNVLTFTIIEHRGFIFLHRIGKHTQFPELTGRKSVGLRRYVDEFDLDLFSESELGADLSAAREILRNLSFRSAKMDVDRVRSKLRPLGFVVDPNAKSLSIILKFELPMNTAFNISRRLDINSPEWVKINVLDESKVESVSLLVAHFLGDL